MEFDDWPVLEHHIEGKVAESVGCLFLVSSGIENDEDVDDIS